MMRKTKENNSRLKVLIENVRLNKKLAHQAKEQDELFDMEFKEIAASDQGASQLRIRRVATYIVDIDKMGHKKGVDPNALLGQLSPAKDRDTPCIMAAGSNTREPVIVKDKGRRLRLALNEDKEALQRYPVGMSCGFSKEISEKTRIKVIGNAWNYHQMSAIFRQLRVPELERQMSNHIGQIDDLIGISPKERKLLTCPMTSRGTTSRRR